MLLVLARSQSHVCSLTVPCTEVEELDAAEPRVLLLSLLVPPIAALPCSPLCKVTVSTLQETHTCCLLPIVSIWHVLKMYFRQSSSS